MSDLLKIRKDVPARTRVILAIAAWCTVIAVWFALTASGLLPPFSLPSPIGTMQAFGRLWTEYDLLGNVFKSWWRIAQAFTLCVIVAIPLGLLMASFRWLHDFINPVAAPMRSMPITAFLPAFIALFGMDEGMKIGFLWFGMFFYLLASVIEEVNKVDDSILETAWTLGAGRLDILWLLLRASFPSIFGSFRILYWLDLCDSGRDGECAQRRWLHGGGGSKGARLRTRLRGHHRDRHRRVSVPVSATAD